MPVRSLRSSVLKWPDREEVDRAVRLWARRVRREHAGIVRVGYFGSYARKQWGVGSDVDLIVITDSERSGWEAGSAKWDTTGLPVPAELVVYRVAEWEKLRGSRFWRVVESEAVWVEE